MKKEDFRIVVDLHYPDLNLLVDDFNGMGGCINIHILKYHLEYPNQIDEGWMNAYNIFFQNKFRQELTLANTMVGDKCRYN